jgi:hypothetical protein
LKPQTLAVNPRLTAFPFSQNKSKNMKTKTSFQSARSQARTSDKLMACRLMYARAPLDLLTPEGRKAARQARFTSCVGHALALAFPEGV